MYVPEHFKEERISVLHAAIQEIGFASLVTSNADGIEASHLPILLKAEAAPLGTLYGHVARANPQWKSVRTDIPALAIFMGPNTYITPSWYPSKQQTGKVVPTWNYLAVHAYGEIAFYDDAQALRRHVTDLTKTYEARRPYPWAVSDAPADYIEKMLAGIVGFTLKLTTLEGKWKMSQNRSPQDIQGVREGLDAEDDISHKSVADTMAKIVEATTKKL